MTDTERIDVLLEIIRRVDIRLKHQPDDPWPEGETWTFETVDQWQALSDEDRDRYLAAIGRPTLSRRDQVNL